MSTLIKKREKTERLPDFFNFLGNDFFSNFSDGDVPAVNVKETKKAYMLEISAPGYSKKDFDIHVNNNILTISGKKTVEKEVKDDDSKMLRQEFSSSSFSRSFTLPEHVETGNIDAMQKDGILKLTLPKLATAKEDKVKKIDIK